VPLPYAGAREAGVFACRSPLRPNLIMTTVCRILAVDEAQGTVQIENIDAFDGTPGCFTRRTGSPLPSWPCSPPSRPAFRTRARQGSRWLCRSCPARATALLASVPQKFMAISRAMCAFVLD